MKFRYAFLCLFTCLLFPGISLADNIKLGIILPLTGPLAENGIAIKKGFELAIKDHQEVFSGIDFIYEDSQYDPKLSISAYRKLRMNSDVKVIYSWGGKSFCPINPICGKRMLSIICS